MNTDKAFDELQIIDQSCAANLRNDIRNCSGYPIYITDDLSGSREVIFAGLKLYSANDLILDTMTDELFKANRTAAATDSPVIFLVKDKSKIDKLIRTLSAANVTTYYQDLNFGFSPIVSADREQINKAIHDQYKKNFSTYSVMNDFVDVIKSKANTPPTPTGFSSLDKVLGGGLHEGLITIGANTSLGKTTFCQQIADQISRAGHDVFIFSLEMSKHELISKSISRITFEHCIRENKPLSLAKTQLGITDGSRYASYQNEEKSLIQSAIEEYKQGIAQGLYIYESVADMTVNQIEQIIETHYEQTRSYPVVIIDYLQLLQHEDKYINANDKLRTDVNITSLKRISRSHKIPIIAISSFNRTSYNQDEISLAAFKESGGIEYSSDVIIGLKYIGEVKSEENTKMIELMVLKNRQGKKDQRIDYTYNPMFNHYEEMGFPKMQISTILR